MIVVSSLERVKVGTPLMVVETVMMISVVTMVDQDSIRGISEAATVVAGTTERGVIEAVRKKSFIELLKFV